MSSKFKLIYLPDGSTLYYYNKVEVPKSIFHEDYVNDLPSGVDENKAHYSKIIFEDKEDIERILERNLTILSVIHLDSSNERNVKGNFRHLIEIVEC